MNEAESKQLKKLGKELHRLYLKGSLNIQEYGDVSDMLDVALTIHIVIVPKGTLCECKGSGGIRMNGTCARCTKPLELEKE